MLAGRVCVCVLPDRAIAQLSERYFSRVWLPI
jgi:hypothetical protein